MIYVARCHEPAASLMVFKWTDVFSFKDERHTSHVKEKHTRDETFQKINKNTPITLSDCGYHFPICNCPH